MQQEQLKINVLVVVIYIWLVNIIRKKATSNNEYGEEKYADKRKFSGLT